MYSSDNDSEQTCNADKKRLKMDLCTIGLCILLFLPVRQLIYIVLYRFWGDNDITALVPGISVQLLIFLTYCITAKLFFPDRTVIHTLNLQKNRDFPLWKYVVWTAVMLVSMYTATFHTNILNLLFDWGWENEQELVVFARGTSLLPFMMVMSSVVLLAPVTEEILFRGMLFRSFNRFMPECCALILVSFIFAAVHFSPISFPALFVMALLMQIAAKKSGSLFLPLVMHTVNNFCTAVIVFCTRP